MFQKFKRNESKYTILRMYPALVIHRNNPYNSSSSKKVYVCFEVFISENESTMLPCNYVDLIDFCIGVVHNGFVCNVYGYATASILSYKWKNNDLIVHHNDGEFRIRLSQQNIYDFKNIANSPSERFCILI